MNDLRDRLDWLIWRWDEWRQEPLVITRQWWCGRRGHGPYRVDERTSFDVVWQYVRCQRCGKTIGRRSEPNPQWWAERQAEFREAWESR